jgi:hypothetical protein
MADARLSPGEVAALNAAAVTREYRVHPRLGQHSLVSRGCELMKI